MRIEIYLNGRHLESTDLAHGFTNYLAFMAARYHSGSVEIVGTEKTLAYMFNEYASDWLNDMFENHEIHIVDISGNRLYDQFLVTEVNNGN